MILTLINIGLETSIHDENTSSVPWLACIEINYQYIVVLKNTGRVCRRALTEPLVAPTLSADIHESGPSHKARQSAMTRRVE